MYSQITAASDWPRLFLHPRCFCLAYIQLCTLIFAHFTTSCNIIAQGSPSKLFSVLSHRLHYDNLWLSLYHVCTQVFLCYMQQASQILVLFQHQRVITIPVPVLEPHNLMNYSFSSSSETTTLGITVPVTVLKPYPLELFSLINPFTATLLELHNKHHKILFYELFLLHRPQKPYIKMFPIP